MAFVLSEQRSELYTWLAGVFLVTPGDAMRQVSLDPEFHDLLTEGLGQEATAPMAAWAQDPTALATMQIDYDELFRVPKGRYVTPFESVYREPYVDGKGRQRRRLMGECSQQVMRYYQAAGSEFSRTEVVSRMPDYIGAELSFMAFLCSEQSAAAGRNDCEQLGELLALQRRFVDEHLSKWVPALCDAIAASDPAGYHAAVAAVLKAHIAADHAWLLATVPPPEHAPAQPC